MVNQALGQIIPLTALPVLLLIIQFLRRELRRPNEFLEAHKYYYQRNKYLTDFGET